MKITKHIASRYKRRGQYSVLLSGLLMLLVLGALLKDFPEARFIVGLVMIANLLASVYSVFDNKRFSVISLVLGSIAVLFESIHAFTHSQIYVELALLVEVPFFLMVTSVLFVRLVRERSISGDTILGSICVYLLIGVTWSSLYLGAELLIPGSFTHTVASGGGTYSEELRGSLIYFSFITLTTTGYGDITALHSIPRLLSVLESIVGQMYIAILVARLVALHVTNSVNNNLNSSE